MIADDRVLQRSLLPEPVEWARTSLRRAAVIAPIFTRAGSDHLLFVVRPLTLREHAGQIAFPGGRDEDDEGPVQCALREAHEEVGFAPQHARVLGELRTRQSSSRYRVHCIVARYPDPGEIAFDPGEVDRVLLVRLSELTRLDRWYESRPDELRDGPVSPHFRAGADVIWGLTGRFARDLVEALTA